VGRFLDGRKQSGDVQADVCVIGGGAAGISAALELADGPRGVTLLEAGGDQLDPEYQELYRATQVGLRTDTLQHNRWRVFGGTTGHWGGWCRPFDPIDFEKRDWVPHSGWPFPREALDDAYRRASALCQIPFGYDAKAETPPSDQHLFESNDDLENMVFRVSPPTRFGTVYRSQLEAAKNVDVMLHASVVDFELDADKTHLVAVKVQPLGGTAFRVRAKHFVLAVGAVETARLLLNCTNQHAAGLGNEHDLVGRFFMQHLELRKIRWVAPSPDARGRMKRATVSEDARMAVRVAPHAQRKRQLLNQHFLVGAFADSRSGGVVEVMKKKYRRQRDLSAVDRAAHELALDVDGRSIRPRTMYFADMLERPEQAPNPDSRLTLDEERDALGLRRTVMNWRFTELDKRSLLDTQRLVAESLGKRALGRVRCWADGFDPLDPQEPLHGGHHHMGTARMHDDPKQGVCDAACRVHGVPNLWIAGSATFPTSGYANPTLTIVAMAVRVARAINAS
jgi:choline dehydrogenase-like flavoprotein